MNVLTFPVMGLNGKHYSFILLLENHPVSKVSLANTCKYSVETPKKFNPN